MNNRNIAFAERIIERYQSRTPAYFGQYIVHRKNKGSSVRVDMHRQLVQMFTRQVDERIKQYQNRYYRMVSAKDNRKFIRTIEQIYNQPGEKKQLIYLLKKLGVVTQSQREWQETESALRQYEEELVQMKRRLEIQEEYLSRKRTEETQQFSTKKMVKEVMERIREEIRMERLRCGLD